jgi:putative ABC transport system permease protein
LKAIWICAAEWNQTQGLPAADGRDLAKKQFGNRLTTFEELRAIHIRSWLDGLLQDVRYAMRGFRRSPVFTIIAIATLAIGIGASTAVFSVVDPLLFRNLPYPHGDRLVSVGVSGPIDTNEFMIGGSYLDWRDRQTAFESLTSMRPASECDLGVESPERIHCISVEANFLHTLRIRPVIGRSFTREEDRPNAPKVALLSYGLWKSRFGGSAKILGKTISLDDAPVRITGVLPKNFKMPQLGEADVLLPEKMDEALARAPNVTLFLRSFGRLKDGVSIEQAREKMRPLFEQSLKDAPASLRPEIRLVVRSVRDRQIHNAKLASWMLISAVLALLLLACANVANLLLARASARKKELAMRAALGAGRGRLVRQTLTESLLLGILGGAVGCGMGWALLRLFVSMAPSGLMRLNEARIDLRVLLFTLAVSLFSSVLFGLLPALERPVQTRWRAGAPWERRGPYFGRRWWLRR